MLRLRLVLVELLFRPSRLHGLILKSVHHNWVVVRRIVALLVLHILPLNDAAEVVVRALFCRILALLEVEHIGVRGVLNCATGLNLLTANEDLRIQLLIREHFPFGLPQ